MYYVKKRLEISAAHNLKLDYESKCENLHESEELDKNGMVLDFTVIKKRIKEKLDHKYLNEIFDFNPTAENIAKWICDELSPFCYRVEVTESEDNTAIYEV